MSLFGSLIGGLLTGGLFGGGKGKTGLQVVGNVLGNRSAQRRQDSSVSRVVADARAAGIHPLAALGSPVAANYGTPVALPGPEYNGVNGRRIALEDRLLDAQIRSEDAKRLALLSEARRNTFEAQSRSGATGGPMPLWVQVADRDGNLLWVPNPDLPDLDQMGVPAVAHGMDPFIGDPDMSSGPPNRRGRRGPPRPVPQTPPAGASRRRRGY